MSVSSPSNIAICIGATLCLVATYGQTRAEVGAAGRSILILTAGIAAAIVVTCRAPQARASTSNGTSARWLRGKLSACSILLVSIHLTSAFQAIYDSPGATSGSAWIDVALVGLPTLILVLVGLGWPNLLPVARLSAHTIAAAPSRKAAVRTERQTPSSGRNALGHDQSASNGYGRSSASPQVAVVHSAHNPARGQEQPSPPGQPHESVSDDFALPLTMACGLLIVAIVVGGFSYMGWPATQSVAIGEASSIGKDHASRDLAVSPIASPVEHGSGDRPPPKSTQQSPPTSPSGRSPRSGASRAPP